MSANVTGHLGTSTDPDIFRDRTLLAGSVELFLFGVVLLSCCCLTFFCFCTSCACFVKHYIPPREAVTADTSIERPPQRDKPPPYEEVEDGLPSYQEAVRRISLVTVPSQTLPTIIENNETELSPPPPPPPPLPEVTLTTQCEIKNEKKHLSKTPTTTCSS